MSQKLLNGSLPTEVLVRLRTLVVETSAATMALCRNGPNVLSPYLFSIVSNVAGVSSKEEEDEEEKVDKEQEDIEQEDKDKEQEDKEQEDKKQQEEEQQEEEQELVRAIKGNQEKSNACEKVFKRVHEE